MRPFCLLECKQLLVETCCLHLSGRRLSHMVQASTSQKTHYFHIPQLLMLWKGLLFEFSTPIHLEQVLSFLHHSTQMRFIKFPRPPYIQNCFLPLHHLSLYLIQFSHPEDGDSMLLRNIKTMSTLWRNTKDRHYLKIFLLISFPSTFLSTLSNWHKSHRATISHWLAQCPCSCPHFSVFASPLTGFLSALIPAFCSLYLHHLSPHSLLFHPGSSRILVHIYQIAGHHMPEDCNL